MTDDFPGNDFPNPLNYSELSFPEEIPAPDAEPDTDNLITVQYSQDWAAVLSAAVDQLIQFATWAGDDDDKRLAVMRANNLKSVLRRVVVTEGCVTYSNKAAFIQWFPNSPFYTPDLVPDGYNQPPWWIAQGTINEPIGSVAGDVLTDITRIPPGSLPDILPASGLPRFRVNVNGPGIVRLKCANIAIGSLLQTTIDDDVFSVQFSDLNLDVISLPAETDNETVIEIEISGAGPHHIDCIIVPKVNDELPFLYHGGGLREVELCGDSIVPDYIATPVRFDQATCTFQQSQDGGETWEPIPGSEFITACFDDLYVNETGDTMSGALHFTTPAASLTHVHKVSDDVEAFRQIESAGNLSIRVAAEGNRRIELKSQAANDWLLDLLTNHIRLTQNTNYSTAGMTSAWIRFLAGGSSVLDVKTLHGSPLRIQGWLNSTDKVKAAIGPIGELWALTAMLRDYSSTGAWRDLGGLLAEFIVPTDATYLGRLKLHVVGYGGAQEAMRVDSDPGGVKIAFRGLPAASMPVVDTPDTDDLVIQIASALQQQGLLEVELTGNGSGPPPIVPDFVGNRCAAAWYVSATIVGLVLRIIDDLQTLTLDELITGVLADFPGVKVSYLTQALAQLELQYEAFGDIETDLAAGFDELAEQFYDSGFDRDVVYTWLAGYLGWNSATRNAIIDVLESIGAEEFNRWIATGMNTEPEPGQDCFELTPCEELGYINMRFGSLPWRIDNGHLVVPQGVHSDSDATNIYAQVSLPVAACTKRFITVTWWAEHNDNSNCIVRVYDDEDDLIEFHVATGHAAGENSFDYVLNPAITYYRIEVQTQAQAEAAGLDSIIRTIDIQETA